jgi:O-antigen/teichoic acid export membrane protein
MNSINKVIFNSVVLYCRLLIGIFIGFFTARIILDALGEVDYGIYALVAGVIGMLAFLNSSMTGTSMRFISVSIGSQNIEKVNITFNSTLLVHIFVALIVALFMLLAGFFLFDDILNIPIEKVSSAKIVYYLMCFSTFIVVISVPFDALISANENFVALSLIQMIGTILNLFIALYISSIEINQLVIYGFLVSLNHLIIRVLKQIYCNYKYREIKINLRKYYNRDTIKEILSFTGWKTLDSSASVIYSQSVGVLINVFFGVTLNAANGVAKQASGQLQNLTVSLLSAINPKIYKSEGIGDRKRMLKITSISAKFSFFMMALLSIPVILELPFLLKLWLKEVPEFTVIFCKFILIDMIISKYTFPINTAISAAGRVKAITFVVLINRVLQFTVSYYLFANGYPPQSIYIVAIIFSLLAIIYKLYFGKVLINLNVGDYVYNVIIVSTIPMILTFSFSYIPTIFLEEGILRLSLTSISAILVGLFSIYKIGLIASEKLIIDDLIRLLKFKIFRK